MNRLWIRLSLAFVVVASISAVAVAWVSNTLAENQFRQYVARRDSLAQSGLMDSLAAYNAATGNWNGVEVVLKQFSGRGQGRGVAGVRFFPAREPVLGERDFARQADVHDIAGHDHMVGRVRAHVRDEAREHAHVVLSRALVEPVHIAGDALAEQLRQIWPGNGSNMRVGEMGEKKAHVRPSLCPNSPRAFARHLP